MFRNNPRISAAIKESQAAINENEESLWTLLFDD